MAKKAWQLALGSANAGPVLEDPASKRRKEVLASQTWEVRRGACKTDTPLEAKGALKYTGGGTWFLHFPWVPNSYQPKAIFGVNSSKRFVLPENPYLVRVNLVV